MKALLLTFVGLLLAGCTNLSVRKPPSLDLRQFQHVFVVEPFNENHHLDVMFANELRRTGRAAASGPLTMMPENTEAVLTYDARWTWDFKTYLIELNVELRTAHTKKKLADARYYQPSMRMKPPETVVHELVQRLFAE